MSFGLLLLITDCRLMGKLSNELSKGFMSLSVRRIVSLRMIPESEVWSIWGWEHNQVDEAVGFFFFFFSVMPTILWLFGLWHCTHYDWFSVAHVWGDIWGVLLFVFLNLKNFGSSVSDYWTKLKFTFWCLSPDEEWKWLSFGLYLDFLIKRIVVILFWNLKWLKWLVNTKICRVIIC